MYLSANKWRFGGKRVGQQVWADTVEKLRNRAFPEMSGMQTTSEVRKLMAQQISCEGPTLLKWLQTWSLASRNLGRILDPENTGTTTFSTLSAQSGRPILAFSRLRAFG